MFLLTRTCSGDCEESWHPFHRMDDFHLYGASRYLNGAKYTIALESEDQHCPFDVLCYTTKRQQHSGLACFELQGTMWRDTIDHSVVNSIVYFRNYAISAGRMSRKSFLGVVGTFQDRFPLHSVSSLGYLLYTSMSNNLRSIICPLRL